MFPAVSSTELKKSPNGSRPVSSEMLSAGTVGPGCAFQDSALPSCSPESRTCAQSPSADSAAWASLQRPGPRGRQNQALLSPPRPGPWQAVCGGAGHGCPRRGHGRTLPSPRRPPCPRPSARPGAGQRACELSSASFPATAPAELTDVRTSEQSCGKRLWGQSFPV